jgi:methylthioribulose-1-phosphate dehydratase
MDVVATPEQAAAREIVAIGQVLAQRGWVPATSGNLSRRIDATRIAITASGLDKGSLSPEDIRVVALTQPLPRDVSAETPLHVSLYRRDPEIGAVLHTHSLAATVVSRAQAGADAIVLDGYELQKGIRGYGSHEQALHLPLFANSQDMVQLTADVEQRLAGRTGIQGYALCGHGLYAWGRTMAEARRHLEAFEFLLACELERGRYRP